MDFWTVTLVTIACYTLYYYIKKRHQYFDKLQIPYLAPWPLIGNMGDALLRRKHAFDCLRDIYNCSPEAKYVGAFDFLSPVIVLRDPELIKNVTIRHFDSFPDHNSFIDVSGDPLFGGNLFNLAGEQWKEDRNLLSPAFTSSKMKAMFELVVECGQNFGNYLAKRPQHENEIVSTKELFSKYTNDVIATCAFGISVNTFEDPKNDFYVFGREATDLEGLLGLKFFTSRAFPKLMKIFRIKFVSDHVRRFFTDAIRNTVQTRDEKGISRPDMLQLMMEARNKHNKNLKLDITEIAAHAFGFFFAGFDTTSTQMCIIAHELAVNPDIQQKLREEIDKILRETNGKPTYEKVSEMPYLDAIFSESLRRHTQAGFLDRLCVEEFELPPTLPGRKPFVVKPGMSVWIPAVAIHMDPKYYDNPEKFDPDRYYSKKVSINDVYNLGFGIGPRRCIGSRLAILETKIMIFFLLSKFNLKPNKNTSSPFKYSKKCFSIVPEGGFSLTIEPRS